jgi:hypothetical protein
VNTASNLVVTDETTDTKDKVYYVSRLNPKLPWPSNATIVDFVTGGKYKKFRILSIGDPNLKLVQIK